MNVRVVLAKIKALLRKDRLDREFEEELQANLHLATERHQQAGKSFEEARRAAVIELGGMDSIREVHRDARGVPWIETTIQDVRYALRGLRKTPALTAVVVTSLALGIGANTAVFTLIHAAMLRLLPVHDPQQLVVIQAEQQGDFAIISFPMYRDFRAQQLVFTDVFATAGETPVRLTVPGRGAFDNVRPSFVTASYFPVLGIQPQIGRFFTEEEDSRPSRAQTEGSVAVLSDAFWTRQFGRDPDVIGRVVHVSRAPCRIIGVAPRGFTGEAVGNSPDMWVPLVTYSSRDNLDNRRGMFTSYMGRLKPGVTPEHASASMTALFRRLIEAERREYPETAGRNAKPVTAFSIAVREGRAGLDYGLRRTFAKPLWIVMVIVAAVLLIACGNVANLMLARATWRRREFSLRIALGCSRRRLVGQLLTESLLLASLGAAAGLALAYVGSHALMNMAESTLPRPGGLDLRFDWPVLQFLVAITFGVGMLFGLGPAVRTASADVMPFVNEQARGSVAGRVRQRVGRTLVIVQVAFSLVLLVTAGLLIRSIRNLHNVDLGFQPEQVIVFDIAHGPSNRDPEAMADEVRGVWQRVHNVPGVESASLSGLLLFSPSDLSVRVRIAEYSEEPVNVRWNSVSPGYIETVGMKLIEGRTLRETDGHRAPLVAVINAAMARKYFGQTAGAVGRTMEIAMRGLQGRIQVVGIVADAKYNDFRKETAPMFYIPIEQLPRSIRSVEVRTKQPMSAISEPVRRTLGVTPNLMIRRVFPLSQQVESTIAAEHMIARLSAVFGGLALLLACVGLYGVVSYSVALRTTEIGVRMALGATRASVLRMILGQSTIVVVAGIMAGVALSLVATRLLVSFLYGLRPSDPVTMAVAGFVLLSVAAVAVMLPARRATRIDPAVSLRYE